MPASVPNRLAALVDQLYEGIMLLDLEWRIAYANPMAFALGHLTIDDLNGKTIWELYPVIIGSPIGLAYLEAAATGEERHILHYVSERLNTTFEIHMFPTPYGMSVHFRDIIPIRRD